MAAEESVLQTTNRPTLKILEQFIAAPSSFNASRLVGFPALLAVLTLENGQYSKDLLDMCKWIHLRGSRVLQALLVHVHEEPREMEQEDSGKVCSIQFYHFRFLMVVNLLDWKLLQYAADS